MRKKLNQLINKKEKLATQEVKCQIYKEISVNLEIVRKSVVEQVLDKIQVLIRSLVQAKNNLFNNYS